jgi:anthranilate synthase component 2
MILVVDNYDSFTFNLVHYLEELGADVQVIRNDAMTADEAIALGASGIVLSPGPCSPNEAGICLDIIRQAPDDLPILGVCLGHQAIGQALGGTVAAAKSILHGKASTISHTGTGICEGIDGPFEAIRYHSLAVLREDLPNSLRVDAWTDDGEIMAISHVARPLFGVQFHPESIGSEHGHALLANFLRSTGQATIRTPEPVGVQR